MTKEQINIINKTRNFIKNKFENEGTGHDWWHMERVFNIATSISKKEKADLFIVQLAALLHDISDFKFNGGDESLGGKLAEEWLASIGVKDVDSKKVRYVVDNISFKGLGEKNKMKSTEGLIVQDADRLDAIGAIGIARCFAYGGSKNRSIYIPVKNTDKEKSFEEYKKGSISSFHHFEDKLLHLKDLMNTKTGKKVASERHKYLKGFAKEFLLEWAGNK